jgi:fructose-bisphosphate aldolase class 1
VLYTAPGIGSSLSGAILFREALTQRVGGGEGGPTFVEVLREQGVVPGVKVDEVGGRARYLGVCACACVPVCLCVCACVSVCVCV